MRICIDLDGVVCSLRRDGEAYADLVPMPGACAKLKALRRHGHYLILATARHMKTCDGNVGKVLARQGKTLFGWLERHGIEVDEIYFGKPHADVYLDDNAFRFASWDAISDDGASLPTNREKLDRRMTIVVPMAGRGSRFVKAGTTTPKPLIRTQGRPMYAWAMDSLPLALASRIIFVCLKEHLETLELEQDIRGRYAHLDPIIVPLDQVTEGQACTVLTARGQFAGSDSLLIYNADTFCVPRLERILARHPETDGVIGVFQAPGDHWSFVRLDGDGRVVETAEKRRISDWAATGLYYFKRADDFVRHAEAMIEANERVNGEFYVAPVYNRLIAAGATLRIDVAAEVWALGTPAELERFERHYIP